MKLNVKFLILVCLAAFPLFATAQFGSQLAVPNSPAFEKAAAELRDNPPRQYDFAKAMISDVFRLMAEDAGISFFGLPDGSPGADRLVTFSIHASPFSALETLAAANGISLIFENGIWYIRPANDTELIGRIYQINYNAQELVRKNDQSADLGGGSSGGSGSGSSSIGLNLQGAPDFFVTEPSRLLEDIRGILDLGTTGRDAIFAPVASVDTVGQLSLRGLPSQSNVTAFRPNAGGEAGAGSGGESGESQAKVIWNSDSNSLYVVSTRQQHQWIEGYLAAADQPQPLVAIEVKVLETNKDPRTELGIDWTGTLAGGYGASLTGVEDLDIDEDTGIISFTETEDGSMSSLIDLDRAGDYRMPLAILSYDEVNLRLRALFDDRKTKAVSYPRMITVDNREVSFRSVVNQPVLSSSASSSLGAGGVETNSVEYVPIGTVINILPKRMNNGQVLLNISIVMSDIIGTEIINGNPFPIATSRVYTAPVLVESGYTIAISGLDATTHERNDSGVPFLGRIPIIGYAFKHKKESKHNQHLMMLITPTLMGARAPGVGKRPTIRNPWDNQPLTAVDPSTFGPARTPHSAGQMAAAEAPAPPAPPIASTPTTPAVIPLPAADPVEAPAPAPSMAESRPATQRTAEMEKTAEPMPVAKPQRKRFLGGLFTKRKKPANQDRTAVEPVQAISPPPLPITPAPAPVPNSSPVIAAAPLSSTTKKKGWNPFDAQKKPVAAPLAAAPVVTGPTNAPVTKKNLQWDGNRLAGGADAIPGAVAYLQQEFEAAEKNADPRKFSELHAHSERLLRYVDDLRENEGVPIEGKLSDDWWNLVALKTKAKNMTRSNAPVLVDQMPQDFNTNE